MGESPPVTTKLLPNLRACSKFSHACADGRGIESPPAMFVDADWRRECGKRACSPHQCKRAELPVTCCSCCHFCSLRGLRCFTNWHPSGSTSIDSLGCSRIKPLLIPTPFSLFSEISRPRDFTSSPGLERWTLLLFRIFSRQSSLSRPLRSSHHLFLNSGQRYLARTSAATDSVTSSQEKSHHYCHSRHVRLRPPQPARSSLEIRRRWAR